MTTKEHVSQTSSAPSRMPWWRVRLVPLTLVFGFGVTVALLVLARVDPYVGRVVTEWVLTREQRVGAEQSLLKSIFGIHLRASANELFRAIRESNFTDIDVLLNSKVSPDSMDEAGRSALRVSVEMGAQTIVMLLVSRGADVNFLDSGGMTPLIAAVKANSVEGVMHLLQLRVDVNRVGKDGETPLFVAVSEQNTPLVDILLGQQSNVNMARADGKTPLMVAIERDNPTLVARLLAEKANVNMKDSFGDSALAYAVRTENVQLIGALLSTDVNLEARNERGETAADIALSRGGKVASLFSQAFAPRAADKVVAEVIKAPTGSGSPFDEEVTDPEPEEASQRTTTAATEAVAEKPAAKQMTRLRIIGKVEGTWERRKAITLTAVRIVVRNVGDYKAESIMISVKVPGGDTVTLTGPVDLERNATGEYTASAYKVVRQMGDLKAEIFCSNCYR